MLQQPEEARLGSEWDAFGRLIFAWRGQIKRPKVYQHLEGWGKDTLHRLEKGEAAPAFGDLRDLFRALWLSGSTIPLDGSQLFVKYARARIEKKGTHRDLHNDEEWSALSYDLAMIDCEFRQSGQSSSHARLSPLLMDTANLIGREQWRENMKRLLSSGSERKKIIVVEGPSGIGKTSEVNRLAAQFFARNTHRPILFDFHAVEQRISDPEEALNVYMSTVLSALGYAQPQNAPTSLEERVMVLLEQLEESSLPAVLFLDHAESILQEEGRLAKCWERFLSKFLRTQHRATLIVATKQWPTWFSGELRFLAEAPLPPLPENQGVLLLQQLGLASVPLPLLQAMSEKVRGIPLCLEWVAALAQQPLFLSDDQDLPPSGQAPVSTPDITQAVRRLLAEPYVFSGPLSEEIAPLLEQRILSDYRLSREAHDLLETLALATVPLAKPALDVVSPQWARVLRELRRASLTVAYADRVQVLPSVASAVIRALSNEERSRQELSLIEAYDAWLADGTFYENEKASLVTELTTLQLTHRLLFPAAQLLIRYGWLAFNAGHAIRLAQLAKAVARWEALPEDQPLEDRASECGKHLLHYFLAPYLGEKISGVARTANYQRLLDSIIAGSLPVTPHTELFIVRHLAVHAMNQKQFADAQSLVSASEQRLAHFIVADPDLQASILEKYGFIYTSWCEDEEEQDHIEAAQALRQQVITVYQQSEDLLIQAEARATSLKSGILKKRLARALTNHGFHLRRLGRYEEAIEVLRQSVLIKEQGYTEPGSLAASYGDLSQALLGADHLSEAERYDTLAWEVVQHLADAGDTISQENAWIYRVNRGRLYARLGRLDEAESLLLSALDNLHERWGMYRMFARQTLEQIKGQRTSESANGAPSPDSQTILKDGGEKL